MKKKAVITLLLILFLSSCTHMTSVKIDKAYKDSSLPIQERVTALLSSMTIEEKIGQMTQIDKNYLYNPEDIRTYALGSLLSGGGSSPEINTPKAWADMYDEFQSIALESRLGIPLIYGVDAVHGHNNVKGAVIFPHNIGLGATRNSKLVEETARITAIEVAGTGIDWNFAPCIAVPRNERWGRTYEGFGEDPELVATLGAAAIRGYQGSDLAAADTILATAKHYVADGGTEGGDDQGDAVLSEEILRTIHLYPYIQAIEEKTGSIMASFSSWNGKKIHGHDYLLTDVLKEELDFQGFVVSDWAAVKQLPGTYKEQIASAINAGIDMVMVPDDYILFIETLKLCIKEGLIPQERIDDAVGKILTAKFELNLFEAPLTDRSFTDLIGSDKHRTVARQAVRESIVLLKNQNDVLPLSKDISSLMVAGKNADNLGGQCGGWTIEWQGKRGNELTEGTTILEGIEEVISESSEVIFSVGGREKEISSDTAVVVIGESPYAESKGDRKNLGLQEADVELVKKLKQQGKTVITVLISGRPMLINDILEYSDAFIAAWLPGTEGGGVADVLFGEYNPTGKLPHTWPRSMDQIPMNLGDDNTSKALFPYGFGISY